MGNFILTQNSFANGAVSPEFFGRENINGLSKLENMDVLPAGGIRRRRGLKTIVKTLPDAQLIPFSVSQGEDYIMSLTAGHLNIYQDGARIQDIQTPWSLADLPRLQYAQRFGTMIFVHPDYPPQVLKKTTTRFELSEFAFAVADNMDIHMPFIKFDDAAGVKITVTTSSRGNRCATFTTNRDFWTPENVQGTLHVMGKQWTVIEYISPTVVIAETNGTYTVPNAPISDWREVAFGTRRGWPRSITFHQDRLVFGGSRDWPAGVWMSRVGVHNNFDAGTGLDDEAIFITLLSEQRQQICTIISSDNLQILTSAGEWAISNKPLTPSAVNIKQHTSVGSFATRFLPPQKIESGTVFVAASGRDIREMSLDELGENYRASDLCALSKHLISAPIDMAYNDRDGQLFVVMENGDMAVLNKNVTTGIAAWGVYKTDGLFKSVAIMDGETYVSVNRGADTFIEMFSDDELMDAGAHSFLFTAVAMPMLSGKHSPKKIRIRKLSARVMNTKSLSLNGYPVAFPNVVFADEAPGFSGDVSVNMLGGASDASAPAWTIGGNAALPATVLSVTINGWYTV